MKDTKTTSRTSLLNLMLLKAWRERWTDAIWGINIKTVLPRGVSGDVYNLADCILQQATIGSNANLLALSYLKHSLCAHLISHAAVLRRIAKYEDFDKIYCLNALLDLLNSIMDGVTCRGKPEEGLLPNAVASLVLWLMKIISAVLKINQTNHIESELDEQDVFNKTIEVVEKIIKNDFLLGILFISKQEENDIYNEIRSKQIEINTLLKNSQLNQSINKPIDIYINQLANIEVDQLDILRLNSKITETITFCVQPLFAVSILVNVTSETNSYVSQMLMIQRLKGFTTSRLFYEIIRSGLLSLSNSDISHDAIWSEITMMKMPHIFKQIYSKKEDCVPNYDHIPDVIEALEMVLDDSFVLDYIDMKCEKNFIKFLLEQWLDQHVVTENHVKIFGAKREPISPIVPKRDPNAQPQSFINLVPRAKTPLSGLLKTLIGDYNKIQGPLREVLCQVLIGNSFDLILQLATVEGHLRTFVSRLIKCNENSKQVPGETGKSTLVRAILFDVSFSMLTFIVQSYGSDIIPNESSESFFAKWTRGCMIEKNRMNCPKYIVGQCDDGVVDEILATLNKPDGNLMNCNATVQEICMNIPGVLYQVLIAWENQTLSSTDVKKILERIQMRPFLFSYSICAASYLCAYMQTVKEEEFLKPHNMVHLLITNTNFDDMPYQEHMDDIQDNYIKERYNLANNIIRKMFNNVQPTSNSKLRNLSPHIVSNSPIEEQFRDVWKNVIECGWLSIKSAQILESLLQTCGSEWLVNRLVEEILKSKYTRDMLKIMDIVFAIMHLDIEGTANALLQTVIPQFLVDKQTEPQSSTLARLCVYSIISNLETTQTAPIQAPIQTKKRSRYEEMEIDADPSSQSSNSAKLRKLNADLAAATDSCSNDFMFDQSSNNLNLTSKDNQNQILKETLQVSLQALFKMFSNFVISDELSPRIYFIFQFITLLVECGKERIKPILKLIPNTLIQNLLKVMATDEVKVGLICRLYDLRIPSGRVSAVSDLSLLRNIRMRKQSINL